MAEAHRIQSEYLKPVTFMDRPLPSESPYYSEIRDANPEVSKVDTAGEGTYTHLQPNQQQATRRQEVVEMEVDERTPGQYKKWQTIRKCVIFFALILLLLLAITGAVFIGLHVNKSSGKSFKVKDKYQSLSL